MNIYKIAPKYHVTGVLKSESVAQLERLGIFNSPDNEALHEEQSKRMRISVTETGMAIDYNPGTMTNFSPEFAHPRAPENLFQKAAHAGMDIASMKDRLEQIYHSGEHY